MENLDRCPNCNMQLEDPEACNYCSWTRNELLEESKQEQSENKKSEER